EARRGNMLFHAAAAAAAAAADDKTQESIRESAEDADLNGGSEQWRRGRHQAAAVCLTGKASEQRQRRETQTASKRDDQADQFQDLHCTELLRKHSCNVISSLWELVFPAWSHCRHHIHQFGFSKGATS
uniref:ANK_REP_REGION domain-containing protein n=1 Tax=Macrostomum lignano TaxID=282301 RepID=A0A1I8FRF5_9PLAT